MKPFRKSRDFDGRFALRTLQNPNLDVSSRFEEMYAAKKRAEAKVAAEEALLATNSSEPSPSATRDEVPASPSVSESAPDRPNILEDQASPTVLAPESEIEVARNAESNPEPQPETAMKPSKKKPTSQRPKKAPQKKYKRGVSRSRSRRRPEPEPTALERHARKCIICNHPEREDIDDDFLHWRKPDRMVREYEFFHHRSLRRHARATGLYERRRTKVVYALDAIIEQAETVVPSADSIIRAVRACSRLNERGEWHDPPSHVIVSSGGHANAPNGDAAHTLAAPQFSPLYGAVAQPVLDVAAIEVLPALSQENLLEASVSNRPPGRLENNSK